MLDYAYFRQSELYDCYRKVYTRKELYFFLSYPQKDFLPNIYCNDSDYLQFVSLNSAKEIISFFNGYINKDYQRLQNLEVINFTGQPNITFSKDVENYFDEVFLCKNLRKIEFTCIEENPALKLYRKLIKKLGGREVGIQLEEKKLTDGKFYNNVIFEIFKEKYIELIK